MRRMLIAVLIAPLVSVPVYADEKHHVAAGNVASATSAAASNEGEVRKIDKGANKITIKHGPLAKLDMPPMTMVFQVKEPAMLDAVQAGDKVRFDAEKVGGAYVVTRIETTK